MMVYVLAFDTNDLLMTMSSRTCRQLPSLLWLWLKLRLFPPNSDSSSAKGLLQCFTVFFWHQLQEDGAHVKHFYCYDSGHNLLLLFLVFNSMVFHNLPCQIL